MSFLRFLLLFSMLILAGYVGNASANIDCARQFIVTSGKMTFFDSQTGANNTYNTAGLSVVYSTSPDGNILGFLGMFGTITRISSTPGNPLSSPAGVFMTVSLSYRNFGALTTADTPIIVNGLGNQVDWNYFALTGGQIVSQTDPNVAVVIRGKIVNNRPRKMQVGSGAGNGNLGAIGLTLDYDFRFMNNVNFRAGGLMQMVMRPSCPCNRVYLWKNFDSFPFQSGQVDWSVLFDPPLRRRTQSFYTLKALPTYMYIPTMYGYDPSTPNPSVTNNYIFLRGFVQSDNSNDLFLYNFWFKGVPNNVPVTNPYGRPFNPNNRPTTGWMYFNLQNGTINHVNDNSGYRALQLKSGLFPGQYNVPPGQQGPAMQIGSGANILSTDPTLLGAYFPYIQQFINGGQWIMGNISIAIRNNCG